MIHAKLALTFGAALLALAAPAYAQEAQPGPEPQPGQVIDFAADLLSYDDAAQVVTASGNVVMAREGYRLRANEVIYDRKTGQVEARGNVVVIDPGGNRAFGDRVQLTESLRDGAIDNILVVLQDGGRLAAVHGTRVNGRSELDRAVYSPCEIDDSKGCPREPLWQIKAVKVVHDPARQRIFYNKAFLEVLGVPILYIPAFSHPDGKGGNASGLLVPDLRLDRSLGLEVELPYYVRFAPNRDLTITPHLYTEVNPALGLEYRHLTNDGPFRIGGMATYSSRFLSSPSDDNRKDFRGYFYGNGRLQHSPRWRSTFGVRLSTDDTFLRRYDISRDDTLRNFYSAEYQSAESYLAIETWAFQGLRQTDDQGTTPIALPSIDYQWRPDAEVIGGRMSLRANTLAITRTDGEDVQRAIGEARWDATRYTAMGQRVTATAMLRADAYHMDDSTEATSAVYAGRDGWRGRAMPVGAVDVEWPFAGPAFGGIQTITPRVQFVASPSDFDDDDFANEDSRAIDLEDVNLFSLNRFPGFDRWEGGARVTYGARWTLDRPRWRVEFEGGQSYRFDDKSDIFPAGTGLAGNFSDFVGRTTLRVGSLVNFTHRFRLDKNSLSVRRNEIDATVGGALTYAQVGYVRLNRDIAIDDLQDREELRVGARVQVTRFWSLFGSTIIDLTSRRDDPLSMADGFEPVRHRLGVAYEDECFAFELTWRRDYTEDRDFRRGSTFLVRLSLKNLGK